MLKLGVIGMSEGNGHPYSWSAIINGQSDEKPVFIVLLSIFVKSF